MRACDRARPQPRENRAFLTDERLQVGTFAGHLRRDCAGRIQVPDALVGLSQHPCPIAAYVFRETGRTRPGLGEREFAALVLLCARRAPRSTPGERRWHYDHGLVDEHGHRIEVRGIGCQPQPLRLQRNSPTAGKRSDPHRSDTGNAAQEVRACTPDRTRTPSRIKVLIKRAHAVIEPREVGLESRVEAGRRTPEAMLLGRPHGDEGPPSGKQRASFLRLRVGHGAGCGVNRLRKNTSVPFSTSPFPSTSVSA